MQTKNKSKYIKTLLVDDDDLARKRLKRLLSAYENILVIGEACDGAEAHRKITELRPDLVFMDIEMPQLNGIEVARSLGALKPVIIFVTAFDAYAISAFEVNATDYLLKPVQNARLAASLEKALLLLDRGAPYPYENYLSSKESFKLGTRVSFVDGKDIIIVDMGDISLIVKEDRYSQVFYQDKNILIEEPLNQVINRLDKAQFVFAHRNAIVNSSFVDQLRHQGLRKYVLVMKMPPKREVPVSRGSLACLKKLLLGEPE